MAEYEAYKDSGAEWLGNVPAHWEIIRLQTQLDEVNKKNDPVQTTQILSLTNKLGVVPYEDKGNQGNKSKEDLTDYKIAYPNCIVANSMNILIGSVGLSQYYGCVSPVYYVFRAKTGANIEYLNYLFSMPSFQRELRKYANGILEIRLRVSSGNILKCKVAIPPSNEQKAIVDYLNREIEHIDAIVAEVKASIEEYKAWKQSIIYEAVTKGLDPNVELKDSRVEGMGTIPTNWKITRFLMSNYVRARLGWKGLKAEEYVDDGYPFLSAFNIVNSQLRWSNLNYITQERYDESPEIKLSVGDILLVKDGAGIGKCARIDELPEGEATVNSSLAVITPNDNIHYRYEYYYFLSPIFQNIITRLRNGMGVPHLTQESMKEIYLPLPSIEEQIKIADYLDKKIAELNAVIADKETLVADLEAYKKSLIFEVVTGKRKVV